MRTLMALAVLGVFAAALGAARSPAQAPRPSAGFEHEKHAALLADCTTCHTGVGTAEGSVYPEPTFCAVCHNGTIQPTVDWTPPAERTQTNLRFEHGKHIAAAGNECADCHVESGSPGAAVQLAVVEQCRDCHVQSRLLLASAAWHGAGWRDRHATEAAASPQTCADCHVRADCLDCHRPSAASGAPGYHRADFLYGHPAAAYSRETSCSDCHNVSAFCASCHVQAGLVASGPIGSRYHDAKQSFIGGHGQAARQSLESCVACHAERDCLTCHSAVAGNRFSPHGPGFDAERLKQRNPSMCAVCHGSIIPGPDR